MHASGQPISLVTSANLGSFEVSPDGQSVVYDATENRHVYIIPIEGGPNLQVSGPLSTGERAGGGEFSPSGERVVYRVAGSDNVWRAHVGLADGSASMELASEPVWRTRMSPAGEHVLLDLEDANRSQSKLVDLTSGRAVTIPRHSSFSPDGQFVLYNDGTRVIRIRADGTDPLELTDCGYLEQISPDSSLAVIRTCDLRFLASVPMAGGDIVNFSGEGQGLRYPDVAVTHDLAHVVYRAEPTTSHLYADLYSVSPVGGPVVQLNPSLPANRHLNYENRLAPDDSRVVYTVYEVVSDMCAFSDIRSSEIYSVPTGGGPPVLLSDPIDTSLEFPRTVVNPSFVRDGSKLVFLDGYVGCKFFQELDLFITPADGGPRKLLSHPRGGTTYSVSWYELTPDGQWAIFEQVVEGQQNLYAAPLAGEFPPIALAQGPLYQGSLRIASDSRHLVFSRGESLFSVAIPLVPEPSPGPFCLALFIASAFAFRRNPSSFVPAAFPGIAARNQSATASDVFENNSLR